MFTDFIFLIIFAFGFFIGYLVFGAENEDV
jgi:hypothetical protein